MVKRFLIAICFVMLLAGSVFAAETAIQVDALIPGMEIDGNPISGGKVYTYVTGTTTAKDTYLDRNKVATATNPVILDSEGRAEIYADGLYKFVIKDADDVTILTMDGLSYGVSTAPIFTYLSQYDSLSAAVAAIGVTPTVLVIDTTDVLTANVSIPATITVMPVLQNAIDVNTFTLTLNCGIWSGPYIWMIGTGTVTGSPVVDYFNPTWTKSTLTDSTTPSYQVITLGEPVLEVPVLADFSNATHAHVSDLTGGLIATSIRDTARGLIVDQISVTTIRIDWTEIILQNDSGGNIRASVNARTAVITASGINGLDTGTEAASTWYYVWLINNGTDTFSLLSISSTAPTMPSGYTYKALVGAAYNDASENFEDFYQVDNKVNAIMNTVTSTIGDFGIGTSTSLDISDTIPLTAVKYYGQIQATNGSGISAFIVGATYTAGGGSTTALGTVWNSIPISSTNRDSLAVNVTASTTYLVRSTSDITAATLYITGWEY